MVAAPARLSGTALAAHSLHLLAMVPLILVLSPPPTVRLAPQSRPRRSAPRVYCWLLAGVSIACTAEAPDSRRAAGNAPAEPNDRRQTGEPLESPAEPNSTPPQASPGQVARQSERPAFESREAPTGGMSAVLNTPSRAETATPFADAGPETSLDAGVPSLPAVTVFVAGDSIVSNYADTPSPSDQAGWGQMLPELFSQTVRVDNRARGGRTALWFSLEGQLDAMLAESQPGDYLLVEFGTNDSHPTAEFTVAGETRLRFADPDTDFKQHLSDLYIAPARARGVNPVLVTPPPRNSAYCTGGNSLSRWAQAMRELGADLEVPVADLNARMVRTLQPLCPPPTPEGIFFLRPDGSVDGTHFQETGARLMARLIAEELVLSLSPLADYLLDLESL